LSNASEREWRRATAGFLRHAAASSPFILQDRTPVVV
jgi:hypothetical protein